MKTKIGGLMTILAVVMVLSTVSSTFSYLYPLNYTISNQEVVWTIDTEKLFSGKEVFITTIEVTYYYYFDDDNDPNTPPILEDDLMYPVKIGQAGWQLKLWFDPPTFPENAEYAVVTGTVDTDIDGDGVDDTFSASGPGWAYRWR